MNKRLNTLHKHTSLTDAELQQATGGVSSRTPDTRIDKEKCRSIKNQTDCNAQYGCHWESHKDGHRCTIF